MRVTKVILAVFTATILMFLTSEVIHAISGEEEYGIENFASTVSYSPMAYYHYPYELERSPCRWINGTTIQQNYKYENVPQIWVTPTQTGVQNWNAATKFNLQQNSNASIRIKTFYDDSEPRIPGIVYKTCSGNPPRITAVDVFYNEYFNLRYTTNQKEFVTAHEIGHALGVGHLLDKDRAVMGFTWMPDDPPRVPLQPDISFIHFFYP